MSGGILSPYLSCIIFAMTQPAPAGGGSEKQGVSFIVFSFGRWMFEMTAS
jgi:hypothetical protein